MGEVEKIRHCCREKERACTLIRNIGGQLGGFIQPGKLAD